MGAQSLVIGKMFGEGFQYGKRKISAMPNEEFNALTFEKMMSNARDEMQASIPTMIAAMQDMKPMVAAVVHEFTNYLSLVIQEAPSQSSQLINELAHVVFPHGPTNKDEFNLLDQLGIVQPAFAEDMPKGGLGIPLTGLEDTHAKRVALQKIEDARVARLQDLVKAKEAAAKRLDVRKVEPIGVTWTKPWTQSARLSEISFMKEIDELNRLANAKQRVRQYAAARTLRARRDRVIQQLANLRARYKK